MKKFMINPITGEKTEMSLKARWDIVTIHYNGFETEKYRAVQYNDQGVIVNERTFNTREFAEEYIRKMENESV